MTGLEEWKCPNDSDGDNNCHQCYRGWHCHEYVRHLESELATANERIKSLESCVVLGGDGMPIKQGNPIFVRYPNGMAARTVVSIGNLSLTNAVGVHTGNSSDTVDYVLPSYCFSSPDAVPEGSEG